MKWRARPVLAMLVCALLAGGGHAAEPPAFRHARPIVPAGPGPNRLVVDMALATAARPLRFDAAGTFLGGLEDLRLFAGDGREVPHVVVAPPGPIERWHEVRVVPIAATEKESGFEFDVGDVASIDRLRVTGLRPPFMKRARLEGSGDRMRWVVLVENATVFDLPDERMRRTEIDFMPEAVRYVRLTWDDRHSAPVVAPPGVAVRIASSTDPAGVTAVPLAFERRPSEPGTSRFRVRLPGASLPIRSLELEVGGAELLRNAVVTEPRLVGGEVVPRNLGTALLRRIVRQDVAAAALRIGIAPPSEPDLELIVDDGDNPPLDLQAVWGEMPAFPWIYFESPDGAAITARFGAPSLEAPRYDLEAARDVLRAAAAPRATWGERTDERLAPAAELPEGTSEGVEVIGAPVDPQAFRHRRAIPPGPAGLTALWVDAAMLAHSRSLADVRVVGGDDRQIAFVVEHLGESLALKLPAPTPARTRPEGLGEGDTVYEVVLPYLGLPPGRFVLSTGARVFERRATVWVERHGGGDSRAKTGWEPVRMASWRHVDPHRPAPSLAVDLPPLDTTTLLVSIDDGVNAPLPLGPPELLLPARRLRFVRPNDGPLRLLYGAPSLPAPRYDLALLAPRLLGPVAYEVVPEPEQGPSDHETRIDVRSGQERALWVVLVGAIVILAAILFRLLRAPVPS